MNDLWKVLRDRISNKTICDMIEVEDIKIFLKQHEIAIVWNC